MFPASRHVCVEECVLECVGGVVGVVEGAIGDGPEAFLVASDEGGEGVEVAVDVGAEQVLVAACVAGSPWHGLRLVQRGVAYVGLACWLWREIGLGMGWRRAAHRAGKRAEHPTYDRATGSIAVAQESRVRRDQAGGQARCGRVK